MRLANLVLIFAAIGATAWGADQSVPVSLNSLQPHKVKVEPLTYKGKKAVRVTDANKADAVANEDHLAVLAGTSFRNGTIEADIAGEPGPGASEGARGFVGIAFRIAQDVSKFECFYLRPTNGRADDQVRRNHSAQYVSY